MKKTILLTVLLLCAGLTGCAGEAESSGPEDIVPKLLEPVDVKMDMAKVQPGEIYHISTYSGEVVPHTEELHFLLDGYLEGIYVLMGDWVEEGQVLAALSEEQTIEQIEELEKDIDHLIRQGEFSDRLAMTDIEIARVELAILEAYNDDAASVKAIDIQTMELQLEQARELRDLELQNKQSSLRGLREKLGKNEITAPYSGRIVYVADRKKGDAVQGYAPMIYIADDSSLGLSTEYVSDSAIASADRVCAKIMDKEYEISLIPYETSELVKMALAGEEMKSRFSIDSEDAGLKAGQFAVVMVYQSYRENVLTIPINALYRDGSGQYVYKEVNGARVRCDVKTGMTTDTKAEIVEGLEEGDMVYVKD